jgi:hypothetical protein
MSLHHVNDKISIEKTKEKLLITISGKISRQKFTALLVWFCLWLASGIAIISQLSTISDESTQTFVWVWLAFWAYFLYRIGLALLWRKYGQEEITITKDLISFYNNAPLSGRGWNVKTEDVRNFKNLNEGKSKFVNQYFDSFWVVGGESIGFYANQKLYAFGKQLSDTEANKLINEIQRFLKY